MSNFWDCKLVYSLEGKKERNTSYLFSNSPETVKTGQILLSLALATPYKWKFQMAVLRASSQAADSRIILPEAESERLNHPIGSWGVMERRYFRLWWKGPQGVFSGS